MDIEEFYFNISEEDQSQKVFVLIIYDIINNAKRVKLAKVLQGYGFRVQKSAFEAMITKKKYDKLLRELQLYIEENDSIRIYKIVGKGQVQILGKREDNSQEDIIVI